MTREVTSSYKTDEQRGCGCVAHDWDKLQPPLRVSPRRGLWRTRCQGLILKNKTRYWQLHAYLPWAYICSHFQTQSIVMATRTPMLPVAIASKLEKKWINRSGQSRTRWKRQQQHSSGDHLTGASKWSSQRRKALSLRIFFFRVFLSKACRKTIITIQNTQLQNIPTRNTLPLTMDINKQRRRWAAAALLCPLYFFSLFLSRQTLNTCCLFLAALSVVPFIFVLLFFDHQLRGRLRDSSSELPRSRQAVNRSNWQNGEKDWRLHMRWILIGGYGAPDRRENNDDDEELLEQDDDNQLFLKVKPSMADPPKDFKLSTCKHSKSSCYIFQQKKKKISNETICCRRGQKTCIAYWYQLFRHRERIEWYSLESLGKLHFLRNIILLHRMYQWCTQCQELFNRFVRIQRGILVIVVVVVWNL